MQANIVIVGTARGFDQLTYAIPRELDGRIQPGHLVLVPLRSRRLTGIVTGLGEELSREPLKPIIELLEPRPLFDRAHLELMEFLSSYYMVSLAEAYRSVIPALARVESRTAYRLGAEPDPLARATFTIVERAIVEAVSKRPMTPRQLEKFGTRNEVRAALARFIGDGTLQRRDSMQGRHRDASDTIARIAHDADVTGVRGLRQRAVLDAIQKNGESGRRVEELKLEIDGAGAILKSLARRGLIEIEAAPPDAHQLAATPGFDLTDEQRIALDAIMPAIEKRRYEAFLLWGVTASGKTEIYLNLAARALLEGRSVLFMVPEIALADEIVRSFRARFGSLVGIAHSAQNVSERWASWMAALGGEARIMIGPRSVIFAPIHDLGLIVVDEEHDASYKNEEGIRYHARDLAVALAGFSKCPVVLGSATPSSESFANSRRGRYRLLRLSRRVNERALAQVEIIDMRREIAEARKISDAQIAAGAPKSINGAVAGGSVGKKESASETLPLSSALIAALRENLASGGQSIVFLNRRGFHNFLQCHICGNVIACANCSVSMTFHMRDRSLRCHYCGSHTAAPDTCPECRGYGLKGQGFGTERLAETLAQLIPDARIERMDSDTSGLKGARARMLAELRAREIDILVGTQMITKGFDFPGVTLAAVVLADMALNMPDFRSAERTFQLLTQVAGRAGRGERAGRVIIQTYAPNHYSIRAAKDQDYARFIKRELQLRRDLMYPPFARLAMVRIEGVDSDRVRKLAEAVAKSLARAATPDGMRVLGPAPAPIERIKQRYRWQVMIKSRELKPMREALASMRAELGDAAERGEIYLAIDIDPVRML
ncbi:MAG: primosomal protein N' [Candidatus Binatus sp.]|uniref:replication restart helicase PriA n=1 Tax=Candidatus Binatus sp. TaxID=2811406 RepID=UPI00272545A7|nr:primosomal protein N' [Candidatus Binatus sp.]MDO8433568.1 primosomal protein N' [Candidatus Binatus sp.]